MIAHPKRVSRRGAHPHGRRSGWADPEQFQEARAALPCLDADRLILMDTQIIVGLEAPEGTVLDLEQWPTITQAEKSAQPDGDFGVGQSVAPATSQGAAKR